MIFLKKCMLNFIKTLQNLIPEHTFFTIFKNMYVKYMFLQLYQDKTFKVSHTFSIIFKIMYAKYKLLPFHKATPSKVSHTFSQLKPILYVLFIKPS